MVDQFKTLKPEYRYLAAIPAPAEDWQTDFVGGEYVTQYECERGHVMSGNHVRFFQTKE